MHMIRHVTYKYHHPRSAKFLPVYLPRALLSCMEKECREILMCGGRLPAPVSGPVWIAVSLSLSLIDIYRHIYR